MSDQPNRPIANASQPGADHRRGLRRDLAWLLAIKLAALGLLWLLFFSPAHQPPVDASAATRQLAASAP